MVRRALLRGNLRTAFISIHGRDLCRARGRGSAGVQGSGREGVLQYRVRSMIEQKEPVEKAASRGK